MSKRIFLFNHIVLISFIASSPVGALLFKPVVELGDDYGAILTLANGIIIFSFGLLQLGNARKTNKTKTITVFPLYSLTGFIVDFISLPVVAGFVSAISINMIVHQIIPLSGIQDTAYELNLVDCVKIIINNFHLIRCADTLTGIITILLLVGLKCLERVPFFPRVFNFMSKSRYLILILIGTGISHIYKNTTGEIPFHITGSIVEGHPPFRVPQFSTTIGNETVTLVEMVEQIGFAIVTIPFVSILNMFVVAKVFGKCPYVAHQFE